MSSVLLRHRQFLPAMKGSSKGGRIVNVGSVAGVLAADKDLHILRLSSLGGYV